MLLAPIGRLNGVILANNRCHETKPLPAFQPSGKKKQENRSDRNTMLLDFGYIM